MAHDEGLERQAEERDWAPPGAREVTAEERRMNEEDRGRTPRRLHGARQMGGPIPPEVRAELDRMQDDNRREPTTGQPFLANDMPHRVQGRPETPREQIDRLVREQRQRQEQRTFIPANHQWWTEPVDPQPVNVAAGHRHVINNVPDWGEIEPIMTEEIGAQVARELRRGNHGARIEHGDMKDVAPKQPEPPDIMGKPEDHFL